LVDGQRAPISQLNVSATAHEQSAAGAHQAASTHDYSAARAYVDSSTFTGHVTETLDVLWLALQVVIELPEDPDVIDFVVLVARAKCLWYSEP
jgi:hypothetical protein